MKKKLAALIDVKTGITGVVLVVFTYLAISGKIPVDFVQTITLMVLTYFLGAKTANNNKEVNHG